MSAAQAPLQASLPGEKARQANPFKLLLLATAGAVVFGGALLAQTVFFNGDPSEEDSLSTITPGSIEPIVLQGLPSYETLTERPAEPEPVIVTAPTVDPAAEARRLAEQEALQSPLTFDLGSPSRPSTGSGQSATGDLASLNERLQSLSQAGNGSSGVAAGEAQQFGPGRASGYSNVVLDKPYLAPASDHLVQAGTFIPASLITGVNSDLPGEIVAQVTEPILDSVSGNTLLIPAGAKILGRYDSLIGYGQDRAFIIWDRLLMPNGYSIELDEMAGTDKIGQAGVADRVDYHTFRLFKAILLSSFITAGANVVENSDDNGFTADIGDAAAQDALRIGADIVDRQLNVQPTITIRPGWTMRILVNKDMVLKPYGIEKNLIVGG